MADPRRKKPQIMVSHVAGSGTAEVWVGFPFGGVPPDVVLPGAAPPEVVPPEEVPPEVVPPDVVPLGPAPPELLELVLAWLAGLMFGAAPMGLKGPRRADASR